MNLTLFLLFPLATAIAILLASGLKQIRVIALVGSLLQLALSGKLLLAYYEQRAAGNQSQMLFEYLKVAVPFVEENVPNPFGGGMPSLMKGQVLIAMTHNIESVYKILKTRYDDTANPRLEKPFYSLILEVAELYSKMESARKNSI